MGKVDFGIAIRPLNRYMSESGDMGKVYLDDTYCYLILLDVLGHGSDARSVAKQAEVYLDIHHRESPVDVLKGLHSHLTGTRGAVAAFCRLDLETGALEHTGIGNITVKIIGSNPVHLVARDGIIGYRAVSPHLLTTTIKPDDILLMHSDGIKSSFNFMNHPGLFSRHAQKIADVIVKDYGTKMDDASCIVMKYHR